MTTWGCKSKTIKKILNKKLDDWISSVEDKELKKLLKRDVIVTGGSITSMLMGDEIKDFDVYFKTLETTLAVSIYYKDKFIEQNPDSKYSISVNEDVVANSFGGQETRVTILVNSYGVAESKDAKTTTEYTEEERLLEGYASDQFDSVKSDVVVDENAPRYRPIFLSNNAITLSHKVQLVIRFYGSPTEIHKNYDFAHTKNVFDYETDTLILDPFALECILSKTLIYSGSLYPICSLFRIRKFMDRGWRISAGELVKISWQISELDLTNINIVKEQLTGCDQLYMRSLIHAMDLAKQNDPDVNIDSSYIVQLIDKVFNT